MISIRKPLILGALALGSGLLAAHPAQAQFPSPSPFLRLLALAPAADTTLIPAANLPPILGVGALTPVALLPGAINN